MDLLRVSRIDTATGLRRFPVAGPIGNVVTTI